MKSAKRAPEYAFLYQLDEANMDRQLVMNFVLNKLSAMFNRQAAIMYKTDGSDGAIQRCKLWFGLTLETGPGLNVNKLRIMMIHDADLTRIPIPPGTTASKIDWFDEFVTEKTNGIAKAEQDRQTANQARRTLLNLPQDSPDSKLIRQYMLPTVNPEQELKPVNGWKRWQTLIEMAILLSEKGPGGPGGGMLWALNVFVPK